MKKNLFPVYGLCLFLVLSCNKTSDDNGNNPPPGPGPGPGPNPNPGSSFTITSVSPEYLAWGETLTINGSGFSTNAADYSFKFPSDNSCVDNFQTTVISASATQLKIKAPIGTWLNSDIKCGPNLASAVVTINGKSDTADFKMYGWPNLGEVCSHFGNGTAGDYFVPGDDALLTLEGATGIFAKQDNAHKNVELFVNGKKHPFTWYNGGGTCGNTAGAVVNLSVEEFGFRKCASDPDWNGGWRPIKFKAQVPGTERFEEREYLVKWQPRFEFTGATGPTKVSKSAGGNPFFTITGKNLSYETVTFTPVNCQFASQSQTHTFNSGAKFYESENIYIPLSVLVAGCTYQVTVKTRCGTARLIGQVQVDS